MSSRVRHDVGLGEHDQRRAPLCQATASRRSSPRDVGLGVQADDDARVVDVGGQDLAAGRALRDSARIIGVRRSSTDLDRQRTVGPVRRTSTQSPVQGAARPSAAAASSTAPPSWPGPARQRSAPSQRPRSTRSTRPTCPRAGTLPRPRPRTRPSRGAQVGCLRCHAMKGRCRQPTEFNGDSDLAAPDPRCAGPLERLRPRLAGRQDSRCLVERRVERRPDQHRDRREVEPDQHRDRRRQRTEDRRRRRACRIQPQQRSCRAPRS